MESGPPPSDPSREGDAGSGPQAPPPGPQAPATGPQAPGAPAPGPPVAGPPAPPVGSAHQAPPGPEAPPSGYSGPVPPGGWQQSPAQRGSGSGIAGKPLASWGSRVGATLLDGLILTVPVVVIVVLVVAVIAGGSEVGGVVIGLIAFLAYILAGLFYAPVLMAREGEHNGQTWGKQIVSIRAARDDGRPFEMGFGFVRELAVKNLLFGVVGGFFAGIPTLVDWLWPLWDDQNRALHDMIVKTHVVKG